MRIISGTMRGKKLLSLEGDAVRPTSDRVKEALFDILQVRIEGRRFLDLFAGSGQIGLEALSRGAGEAVLVDASRASQQVIEKNLRALGLEGRARLAPMDFRAFLHSGPGSFDIAFLDPPYRTGLLQEALPAVARHMNPGSIIVCEHPREEQMPEAAEGFALYRQYRYGKIMLTSYCRPVEE